MDSLTIGLINLPQGAKEIRLERHLLDALQLLATTMLGGGAGIAGTAAMCNRNVSRPVYLTVGAIMAVAGAILFFVLP